MPMIRIQTSQTIGNPRALLKKLSSEAAKEIGKPEAYIMTALTGDIPMTFAGTEDPAAFIECMSIGLGETQTKGLSAWLCAFCENELKIPKDRVYIAFSSAKGSMWGWRGGTF